MGTEKYYPEAGKGDIVRGEWVSDWEQGIASTGADPAKVIQGKINSPGDFKYYKGLASGIVKDKDTVEKEPAQAEPVQRVATNAEMADNAWKAKYTGKSGAALADAEVNAFLEKYPKKDSDSSGSGSGSGSSSGSTTGKDTKTFNVTKTKHMKQPDGSVVTVKETRQEVRDLDCNVISSTFKGVETTVDKSNVKPSNNNNSVQQTIPPVVPPVITPEPEYNYGSGSTPDYNYGSGYTPSYGQPTVSPTPVVNQNVNNTLSQGSTLTPSNNTAANPSGSTLLQNTVSTNQHSTTCIEQHIWDKEILHNCSHKIKNCAITLEGVRTALISLMSALNDHWKTEGAAEEAQLYQDRATALIDGMKTLNEDTVSFSEVMTQVAEAYEGCECQVKRLMESVNEPDAAGATLKQL